MSMKNAQSPKSEPSFPTTFTKEHRPTVEAGILNPHSVETVNIINATNGVLESETIRCSNCGYQLIGIAADGRCPECGLAVAASVINTTVVRDEVNINKASRGIGWIFVMLTNTFTVVLFGTCYSDSGHDWTNLLNYLFFLIICGLCTLLQLTVFLPLSLRSVGNVLGGLRMLGSRPSASASPEPLGSFADSLQFALFTAIVISTISCVFITAMGLTGNLGSESPLNRATGTLIFVTFGWVAYVLPKATEWLVTLTNPRGSRGGVQHAFWPIFMLVALLWFIPGLPNVIRVLAGLGVGVMLCLQVLQFRRALAIVGGGSQSPQTEE